MTKKKIGEFNYSDYKVYPRMTGYQLCMASHNNPGINVITNLPFDLNNKRDQKLIKFCKGFKPAKSKKPKKERPFNPPKNHGFTFDDYPGYPRPRMAAKYTCFNFVDNGRKINPITGRKINRNDKRDKKLLKFCSTVKRERAPFIDQTQSMNLFIENPNFKNLSSMHFYTWKQGLKNRNVLSPNKT